MANGTGRQIAGKYNNTPPSYSDGNIADLQTDSNGNLKTTSTAIDTTNNVIKVEQQFSYKEYEALSASTTVKSGAGFLHTVIIGYPGSSDSFIVVRDSLSGSSGTVMAVLNGANNWTATFDTSFSTGLSFSSNGTTTCKITFCYR